MVQTGAASQSGDDAYVSRHISALHVVEAFLSALTNADSDGRISTTAFLGTQSKTTIKYMLLNPAIYFEEILRESRAVIVAGGTMAPMNDFVDQLMLPSASRIPVSLGEPAGARSFLASSQHLTVATMCRSTCFPATTSWTGPTSSPWFSLQALQAIQ